MSPARLTGASPGPDRRNWVSSEASGARRVAPLSFHGAPAEAMAALLGVITAIPRARIVRADGLSVRAEFRSRVFGFVDDAELRLDPDAGVVHVRSASRTGWWDLGVNRRRVERIRAAFAARTRPAPAATAGTP